MQIFFFKGLNVTYYIVLQIIANTAGSTKKSRGIYGWSRQDYHCILSVLFIKLVTLFIFRQCYLNCNKEIIRVTQKM